MPHRRLFSFWPLVCVVISAIVAVPTVTVLASVFADSEGEWAHLAQTRLLDYVRNTLLLACGVGAIALVFGTGTAWLVTACRFPGRRLLRWMLLLPLAVPAYLAAYAYTDLLQFSGPVQTWLRETFGWGRRDYWFPEVRSLPGAIVVLGFGLYPYVYLAARTAFIEHAGAAMDVARTLGRGPWRNFMTVALPMARPSIAAGLLLVLMETLADFGAVDYFAVDTFATGIYRTWRSLEAPIVAAQLSAVLVGAVAVLVIAELIARRRAKFHQITNRMRELHPARLGPVKAAGAFAFCLVPVLIGFAGPTAMFGYMAWTVGDARAFEVVTRFGANTLLLASIAAVLATFLALLVVYGRRLGRGPVTLVASKLAGAGYALPGTVIAIGLLIPLGWLDHRINAITTRAFDWQPGLILTGSIVAVIFAYQARFLGVALAMLESSLGRVRQSMDDAARSLGASGTRLLVRVHFPLLRASVLAALLLVFVDVAKELPATLMLRPFDMETLAVRVYQLATDERLEEAAFGALAIIGIGLIPVAVLSILLNRSPRSVAAPLDKAAFS